MANYDRYDTTSMSDRDRDRDRSGRSRDYGRSDGSIFGFGGSDDDRSRRQRASRESWGGSNRNYGLDRDRYGPDDYREGLPRDETSHLIASNKVEGTSVYGRDGDKLGTIYNFMVDKRSGRVEYAMMSYGGFLGMGTRYYPLPWRMLEYDLSEGGYHVNMSERDLEDAPSFDRNTEPRFDRRYGSRVHDYYGLNY